eukprot:Nk52_evm24s156 gene=Nk52_evmTU24s156
MSSATFDQLVNTILAQNQKFDSQLNGPEYAAAMKKYHSIVSALVTKYLRPDRATSNDGIVTLKLLQHLISNMCQVFIDVPQETEDSAVCGDSEGKRFKNSVEVSVEWLFARLFPLLCNARCGDIRSTVIEMEHSLLLLAHQKGYWNFKRLMYGLLQLGSDLHSLGQLGGFSCIFPVEIESFFGSNGTDIITFMSEDECDNGLQAIVELCSLSWEAFPQSFISDFMNVNLSEFDCDERVGFWECCVLKPLGSSRLRVILAGLKCLLNIMSTDCPFEAVIEGNSLTVVWFALVSFLHTFVKRFCAGENAYGQSVDTHLLQMQIQDVLVECLISFCKVDSSLFDYVYLLRIVTLLLNLETFFSRSTSRLQLGLVNVMDFALRVAVKQCGGLANVSESMVHQVSLFCVKYLNSPPNQKTYKLDGEIAKIICWLVSENLKDSNCCLLEASTDMHVARGKRAVLTEACRSLMQSCNSFPDEHPLLLYATCANALQNSACAIEECGKDSETEAMLKVFLRFKTCSLTILQSISAALEVREASAFTACLENLFAAIESLMSDLLSKLADFIFVGGDLTDRFICELIEYSGICCIYYIRIASVDKAIPPDLASIDLENNSFLQTALRILLLPLHELMLVDKEYLVVMKCGFTLNSKKDQLFFHDMPLCVLPAGEISSKWLSVSLVYISHLGSHDLIGCLFDALKSYVLSTRNIEVLTTALEFLPLLVASQSRNKLLCPTATSKDMMIGVMEAIGSASRHVSFPSEWTKQEDLLMRAFYNILILSLFDPEVVNRQLFPIDNVSELYYSNLYEASISFFRPGLSEEADRPNAPSLFESSDFRHAFFKLVSVFLTPKSSLAECQKGKDKVMGALEILLHFLVKFPGTIQEALVLGKDSEVGSPAAPVVDLLDYPAFEVRTAVSKIIRKFIEHEQCLDQETNSDALRSHMGIILKKLKSLLCVADKESSFLLQETLLCTVGDLAYSSSREFQLLTIVCLIEFLSHPNPLLRGIALRLIREIAKVKDASELKENDIGRETCLAVKNLFRPYMHEIASIYVETVHKGLSGKANSKTRKNLLIDSMCQLYEKPDEISLTMDMLSFILPQVVRKSYNDVLSYFANLAGCKENYELLINNTQHIFAFIFTRCKEVMPGCINFLLEACVNSELKQSNKKVEIVELLRCNIGSLLNELVFLLGDKSCESSKRKSAANALELVAVKLGGVDVRTKETCRMREFLSPYLLGIMAYLNDKLVSNSSSFGEKLQTLNALIEFINIMGPKLEPAIPKVMALLRTCLQDQKLVDIAFDGWIAFVNLLAGPDLGPVLSQIIYTVLPFVNTSPKKVQRICETIIVVRMNELRGYILSQIYFLPNEPALSEANLVLREERSKESRKDLSVEEIMVLTKGIDNENINVKKNALKALCKTLKRNQDEFADGSFVAQLSSIAQRLIEACRENESELQSLIAKCIGQLGALDPSRLEVGVLNNSSRKMIAERDIEDAIFVSALVENHLVKAFLASPNTKSQDMAAYAIQEILKINECSLHSDSGSKKKKDVWSLLSDGTKSFVTPYLHTRYIFISNTPLSFNTRPLFDDIGKSKGFKEWVSVWVCDLIENLNDGKAKKAYSVCKGVVKDHVDTALFLLPCLVLRTIRTGANRHVEEIFREITCVIGHAVDGTLASFPQDCVELTPQTIFSIIDHIYEWRRLVRSQRDNCPELHRVTNFLNIIPHDSLATGSYNCKSYPRALMSCEMYLKKCSSCPSTYETQLQTMLGLLQKIYLALEQPFGVEGVAAIRKETTVELEILDNESAGNWNAALSGYERALRTSPENISNHTGLLKCSKVLGHLETIVLHVNGVIGNKKGWSFKLLPYSAQALWRLEDWGALKSCLNQECDPSFEVYLAQLLLYLNENDFHSLEAILAQCRSEILASISAASMEFRSYRRSYSNIVKLHMLHELEAGMILLRSAHDEGHEPDVRSLTEDWKTRLDLTSPSFEYRESILSLRRVILGIFKKHICEQMAGGTEKTGLIEALKGGTWIDISRIARESGLYQTTYSCHLHAAEFNVPDLYMEAAKLEWDKGNHHKALLTLRGHVERLKNQKHLSKSTRAQDNLAECALIIGIWMEETSQSRSLDIVEQFKEVTRIRPKWEKGHFHLGKYFDTLYGSLDGASSAAHLKNLVKFYGNSLMYGNSYIFQALPRLLEAWMEYGESTGCSAKGLDDVNEVIYTHIKHLPAYQLYTCFSQLMSRICHPNVTVFAALKSLVVKVINEYPQQGVWSLLAIHNSTDKSRKSRCKDIVNAVGNHKEVIKRMICLSDSLISLCDLRIEQHEKSFSLDQKLRKLRRNSESGLLVPIQSSLTCVLPTTATAPEHYSAFPGVLPTIYEFEDRVELMASLQRPRKFIIVGSDGVRYPFLAKPKDDLRKDSRVMELNSMINRLLKKDQSSRNHQLHIRTYAVVPLNEDNGLIEWVSNMLGFKGIVMKIYQKEKIKIPKTQEIMQMMGGRHSKFTHSQQKHIFENKILPKFPPVFSLWYVENFPDPNNWYSSRLLYASTTAVMSMAGYVVGLGDRHGENILFDSVTGESMHVDLNCLFNKGETFETPERVPFRLTHNMIDALGPTGVEGPFRKTCEVTMRLFRKECDSLLSVLRPFLHDPLLDWTRSSRGPKRAPDEVKRQASKVVNDIEKRLRGKLQNSLPISIEGQVHELIHQATDNANLSLMYVGWGAYL